MPKNDNAFKVLFQRNPQQFLNRLLPGATVLEVLPTELPRESLYVDALLRIRYNRKEYIVHIEVQTKPDANMVGRILQYMGLIWVREQTVVLPIILYLDPTSTPDSPWQLDGPTGPVLNLHFATIKLWEQPVEDWLASGESAALAFAPLLKGATIDTLGQAADLLQRVADDAERSNALNYLIMFAIRRFGDELVTKYIKENLMLDQIMLESRWYQIVLGRGEQRGEQRMIQRVLEGRFETLSQDILDALKQADEATLEDVAFHAATDTIEQVRERLGLTTP